jgi:ribonuclease HI
MAKSKFYVVWEGHETGIFSSWNDCKKQIHNYPSAKYKSFETLEMAQKAHGSSYWDFAGKKVIETKLTKEELLKIGKPISESIAVDGACSGKTGLSEYQGVHTGTKKLLFKKGPFEDGTNNIMEFLALVHALAYCQQNNISLPIYSDSKIAISWIWQKKCKTNHAKSSQNKLLFDLIERAEKWLREHKFSNKILKWETKAWGEIPADFNRK